MQWKRAKVWVGAGIIAALIAASLFLPVADAAVALVDYVRGLGAAGIALYAAIYVVATVALVPGSLLTIGAGFVYGLAGAALVWPASVAGASLAFLLGRTWARDAVAARMQTSRRLTAIDAAIGDRGFAIVLLLRLSPVFPFTLLNYSLGLTRARFGAYFAATALGMVPGIFLYVYLGSLVTDAAQLASGDRPDTGIAGQILLYAGLAATLAVTVVITRLARRRLASTLSE